LKKLHRSNFYCWTEFNEERNIDFNGTLWINPKGNVLIDPVPLSEHDINHLDSLGGASHIIITNSDHIRDTAKILSLTGAKCWGPLEEKDEFPFSCDGWLKDGDKPIYGVEIFTLNGSKTNGELAILIEKETLITGDLIRSHEGGRLSMLPDEKLKNRKLAVLSIKRMASVEGIQAVIPGDGWPVFNNGHKALSELFQDLEENI